MEVDEVRAAWRRGEARALEADGPCPSGARQAPPVGAPTFMEAPRATTLDDLEGAGAVVLGIPFDEREPAGADATTSAPTAVRGHSAAYSLRRGRGVVPEVDRDLAIRDRLRLVDYGDVEVVPGDAEATFVRALTKLVDIVAAGATPIVLGGDHSVSIPVLQVLAGTLAGRLGVVALDASFDLDFAPRYRSGSQWAHAFELEAVDPANFVQIGIRGVHDSRAHAYVAEEVGYRYYTIADVDELGMATVAQEALEVAAAGTEAMYVSLDMAVVDTMDGVRDARGPAGLSARELLQALRTVSRGRVVACDLCGLVPRTDPDGRLGRLAARAAVEIVAGLAAQRP